MYVKKEKDCQDQPDNNNGTRQEGSPYLNWSPGRQDRAFFQRTEGQDTDDPPEDVGRADARSRDAARVLGLVPRDDVPLLRVPRRAVSQLARGAPAG